MISSLPALVRRSLDLATPVARAHAEGNMIAKVRITRPTTPVFNRATGEVDIVTDAVRYVGKARVSGMQGPLQLDVGDELQTFSTGTVSIPLDAPRPQVNDVVQVLDHPDPNLKGRIFRVQDVQAGGQMPTSYRMQVSGIQPGREWGDQSR